MKKSDYNLFEINCYEIDRVKTLDKIVERNKKKYILLFFYLESCPICKTLSNKLQKFWNYNNKKVLLCRLNIKRDLLFSLKYKVSEVPTLIILKNNIPFYRYMGDLSYNKIKKILDFQLI